MLEDSSYTIQKNFAKNFIVLHCARRGAGVFLCGGKLLMLE